MIDRLYSWVLVHKAGILNFFYCLYAISGLVFVLGSRSIFLSDAQSIYFRSIGLWSGKAAIIVFTATMAPGIARRFGKKHKLISLLRIFRRYLGILMYLLVAIHSGLVSIIPRMPSLPKMVPYSQFEQFGILASSILFLMFITSNDSSVALLKIWWYRLHRLVYLAMWLVLLHVGLQRISVWTILMAALVVLTIASFGIEFVRKRKIGETMKTKIS